MQTRIKDGFSLIEVMIVVAIIGLLAAMAPKARAAAFDPVTLTNSITATGVISNQTSLAASQEYVLHAGSQLVACPRFLGVGNTNVVFGFDLYNGNTWTTVQPLAATNACAGFGTNVVGAATFSKAQLEGYSKFRWDYTSTTDFTNVIVLGVDVQEMF